VENGLRPPTRLESKRIAFNAATPEPVRQQQSKSLLNNWGFPQFFRVF
jgi:hypothetical protein